METPKYSPGFQRANLDRPGTPNVLWCLDRKCSEQSRRIGAPYHPAENCSPSKRHQSGISRVLAYIGTFVSAGIESRDEFSDMRAVEDRLRFSRSVVRATAGPY